LQKIILLTYCEHNKMITTCHIKNITIKRYLGINTILTLLFIMAIYLGYEYPGYLLNILSMILIYSILSLGLNVRWGYIGIPDFGIAGFFLIGAYTSAILTAPISELDILGGTSVVGALHLPIPVGMLFSVIITICLSFLISLPTLRLSGDYLAVVTLCTSEILRMVAQNENWLTRGAQGIRNIPFCFESIFPNKHQPVFLILLLIIVLFVYFISNCLYKSPFGRVLRAIRDDKIVTASLGKNTIKFQTIGYIYGAVLMGLAGSLWAHFARAVQPQEFDTVLPFLIWACVIIGGKGNNKGVILGTILTIGFFGEGMRFLLVEWSGNPWVPHALRHILIGLLMITMLRFKPSGIISEESIGNSNV